MTMSRKHYREIAHAISLVQADDPYPWVTLAEKLTPILEDDNPSFDRRLFLDACLAPSHLDDAKSLTRKAVAKSMARGAEPIVEERG